MQQAFRWLTSLLDVLFQCSRRIIPGLDNQCVVFPMTDRMPKRTSRSAPGMVLHVDVDDPPHVHPFVMKYDVCSLSNNFQWSVRRLPDTHYRDRIAMEHRIVFERIVGLACSLSRRCQQFHYSW